MKKYVSFEVHGDSSSENSNNGPQTPRDENHRSHAFTRSRHVPTPKISERKKALFGGRSSNEKGRVSIEVDADLGPMSPLKFSNSPKRVPMKSSFLFIVLIVQLFLVVFVLQL